ISRELRVRGLEGAEAPAAPASDDHLPEAALTAGLRLAGPWPTRRSVWEALSSLRGYDLGIRAKASFGPDDERGLRQVVIGRWRGGRFRALESPDAQLAGDRDDDGDGADVETPDVDELGSEDLEAGDSGADGLEAPDDEPEASDAEAPVAEADEPGDGPEGDPPPRLEPSSAASSPSPFGTAPSGTVAR
ncbi:MAG: hypothetical protein AAFY88_26435, partial [Acidobacteriota bacterium]